MPTPHSVRGPGCFQAKPPSGLTLGSEPSLLPGRIHFSTLTFDRRSLSTGPLQHHDDESHQNENGACFHVGLWCGIGADPSPNYTLSVIRKEGGAGGSEAGRVSNRSSPESALRSSNLLFYFTTGFRLEDGFLDMQILNWRVWEYFLTRHLLLHPNLALVSPVPLRNCGSSVAGRGTTSRVRK